ncbi:MAG: tRNA (adenosine(37)-N6)-dimethylallyltransferase MiaA [Kineosporiaceae bacterium]
MSERPSGPVVVAVVGATASGKSDLGVDLALALGGEVVNADAMQLYRGMDIGTAKLTGAERRGVPHHLLDVLDVSQEASVAAYQRQAADVVEALLAAGRTPVVVGGSGLYVRAALDVLEIPPTDAAVRGRWEDRLAADGPAVLHAVLALRDPAAAAAILPSNGRRVVRALEVVELTGRPFSAALPRAEYVRPTVQVGLTVPHRVLDARIDDRVDRMWAAGLVAEVERLADAGLRQGRTASRALGYAQVLRSLAGECTDGEAREQTARATRRFARRQEAWFRRDTRIVRLPFDTPDLVGRALAAVAAATPQTPGPAERAPLSRLPREHGAGTA